eukprot:scaffold82025_cov57-Phaeocystis_antarctica.AAC.3
MEAARALRVREQPGAASYYPTVRCLPPQCSSCAEIVGWGYRRHPAIVRIHPATVCTHPGGSIDGHQGRARLRRAGLCAAPCAGIRRGVACRQARYLVIIHPAIVSRDTARRCQRGP